MLGKKLLKLKSYQKNKNELQSEYEKTFKKLKVENYKNVFITTNLSKLGNYKLPIKVKLDIIYKSLIKSIGKNYTIFCPGMSMGLMKSKSPFIKKKTLAENVGRLPNFILKKKKSERNIHPYWSIIGIGKNSKILKKITINCFDKKSPWPDMIKLNTLQLHIDIDPYKSITLLHHIETILKVPYRLNKNLTHTVRIRNKKKDIIFQYPLRHKKILNLSDKNKNKILFKELAREKKIFYYRNKFNQKCWSFSMKDFSKIAMKKISKNNFFLLKKKPNIRY